jgi:hypothetical protein
MAIKKQEFYEGAALHLLARTGGITSIRYESPFFVLNGQLLTLIKYSTRGRSPWGFTFTPDEQATLRERATDLRTVIALVCGEDGIAAFSYEAYLTIAPPGPAAFHVSCYRQLGEYYEVNGPVGKLREKVSPSNWRRVLQIER